jgi:TRAP-type C4-dicarboxylate transport system permease large subunit
VPSVQRLGIDPVHFAVVFEICTLIGQLTPPVGITMYVTCQIGDVGVEDYTRAIMPFLGAAFLLVILVIHFPQLAVWIPNLLIGVPR